MKLSKKAIAFLRGNNKTMARLAYSLNKSGIMVSKYVADNKSNGRLTTETAIQIIMEDSKMDRSKILTKA